MTTTDQAETTPMKAVGDSPSEVVVAFLNALAANDVETAVSLVADDLVYENISLPTIRGKDRFERGARSFSRFMGFDVRFHRVAENGTTVLTERTDAITVGPYRSQFWVCGVFEVEDGKIKLWRDYFDFWNVLLGSLRGLLGMVIPAFRARFDSAS
jgi:limonene-1,2-epoxide hydrolase